MKNKKFYQIETVPDKRIVNVFIYGTITSWKYSESDVDSYSIINEINALDVDEINVYINSPGGEVGEAVAIYTALKRHRAKVTTYCDGFACSAASIIFCAGDERIIGKLAMLMIHNCMSYAGYANSDELRKIADDTEKINQASIEAYKIVCNIDEEEIKKLMNAETWLTSQEALDFGFATEIAEDEPDTAVQQSAMTTVRNAILNLQKPNKNVEQLALKIDTLINAINEIKTEQQSKTPTNDLKKSFVDFFKFQAK